jgi:hypothetical protein
MGRRVLLNCFEWQEGRGGGGGLSKIWYGGEYEGKARGISITI